MNSNYSANDWRSITTIQKFASIPFTLAVLIQTYSYFIIFYKYNETEINSLGQFLLDVSYPIRNMCLYINVAILLITKRLTKDGLFLILGSVFAILFTSIAYPENIPFFEDIQAMFILAIQMYVVIRSRFVNMAILKVCLMWINRVFAIVSIYVFLTYRTSLIFIHNYMDYANGISIICGLSAYFAIIEKKKLDCVFMAIMYIVLLIAGGRGSFLTMALLTLVLFWITKRNNRKTQKYFVTGAIVLSLALVVSTFLSDLSSLIGFESRNLERLTEGGFFYANDRTSIWSELINKSSNNILLGSGICADRYYLSKANLATSGYYAHNIFVEMMVDFGLVGIVMFCAILFLFRRFYTRISHPEIVGFVSVYVFVSFVQLFLSRSFLTEANFYVMLALMLNYLETNVYNNEYYQLYENKKTISYSNYSNL